MLGFRQSQLSPICIPSAVSCYRLVWEVLNTVMSLGSPLQIAHSPSKLKPVQITPLYHVEVSCMAHPKRDWLTSIRYRLFLSFHFNFLAILVYTNTHWNTRSDLTWSGTSRNCLCPALLEIILQCSLKLCFQSRAKPRSLILSTFSRAVPLTSYVCLGSHGPRWAPFFLSTGKGNFHKFDHWITWSTAAW